MINFTEIFIRRPVLSVAISLFILALGIISYYALPLREYPKVDANVVSIQIGYAGASPELMESYVTTPIENAVGSIDGINNIESESREGFSQIIMHFNLGYDVNKSIADITSNISSTRWRMPKDINDPTIAKWDPNSNPTMYISFRSSDMSEGQLTDYLMRVVQPQLQIINGVGSVQIDGGKQYAMRLWLNPFAMAAHNITPSEVNSAIASGVLLSATGDIKNAWQQFAINAETELSNVNQFDNLIVKNNQGQLTKLKDIGRSELGTQYSDFAATIDDRPGMLIDITPKTDANPLDVSKLVNQALKNLEKYYPAGLRSDVLLDSAIFIQASINEIYKTLTIAVFFVMMIVFIFLGSLRTLLIPTITIPLSIIGVFSLMLALGYSLNTLTLLALVLAVGMVVDDAIVVAENIHRHIGLGRSPFEAAIIGAKEIQLAIISITLTLVAVYAPVGFAGGLTQVLFKEFAFTLAATIVISGVIALTLTPMMCSKIIQSVSNDHKLTNFTNTIFSKIIIGYEFLLRKLLAIRLVVLIFLLLASVAVGYLYVALPKDLAPQEDVGWMWTVMQAPAAANFEFTQKYANKLSPIFKNIPEVEHYGIIAGGESANSGHAFVILKPWDQRKRNLDQIMQELQGDYATNPELQIFSYNPHMLPGAASFLPIEVAVQSTGSYEELNTVIQKLKLAVSENSKIINLDTGLKIDQPQLDIDINRDKAGSLGISMQNIVDAINLAFGEPEPAQFTINGRGYYVIPQLDEPYRNHFDAMNNLQLRTSSSSLVPLANLITLKESIRPRTLTHFQQIRYAKLYASLAPGYSSGEALKYIENVAKKIIPAHMKLDYMGQLRQFAEDSNKMLFTFILAIIFIFLLLSAQFESFRDPLVILLSVPLSLLGALVTLKLTKNSLNIYSEIGLITLIGLITKHGILMVEFAKQLGKQGKIAKDAIVEAAKIRLRPILMTTLAMILGALPLALAGGPGSHSRQQLGWVIVGGMLIGTLFTLFVIPVMYTFLSKKNNATSSKLTITELPYSPNYFHK